MSFFERLYTYRQKEGKNDRENFLTELLAGVLRANPELVRLLLAWLGFEGSIHGILEVHTQVNHPEGRPDLSICSADGNFMLLVECKLEAEEGIEQLSRYEAILKRCGPAYGAVLFLTKYYEPPRAGQVRYLRWHELYAMSMQVAGGELLSGFQEYISLHNLHHPMSFSPTDLLALETIQASIRKMDEVLTPVESLLRKAVGGYYQTAKTREKLHNGWYGLDSKVSGSNIEVGFWSYQGGAVHCFCLAHYDGNLAGDGVFQRALREAWALPESAELNYLERSEPVIKFMTGDQDGAEVVAMRQWFETRLHELAQAVAKPAITQQPQG